MIYTAPLVQYGSHFKVRKFEGVKFVCLATFEHINIFFKFDYKALFSHVVFL